MCRPQKVRVVNDHIPVNEPLLVGNEKKYLLECIESGWISSEGPFVKEFEQRFAKKVGRKYGIAVVNGTAAIDVAIDALGIGPGDEVILPTFTIISCVLQIVRSGAIPVLVDSDPINWNMNILQIEKKITNKTKAIMVVHVYGLPVDMDPVLKLAANYGIYVIEDAAEMHGQTYWGKPCGSFGDISTFSFYSNKHVTTGEGGMVVTNDETLAETCRSLRNLCFQPEQRFVHERLGWNYRMTNMQAAIGLAQLEQLDDFVIKKREMGLRYTKMLQAVEELQIPQLETEYSKNIFWVYGLILANESPYSAQKIMNLLAAEGIGTRPFFCPLHMQPVLRKMGLFKDENYPAAERMYERGFYLPSGMAIKPEQQAVVVEKLKTILWKK
jgi:perosamine synthetase